MLKSEFCYSEYLLLKCRICCVYTMELAQTVSPRERQIKLMVTYGTNFLTDREGVLLGCCAIYSKLDLKRSEYSFMFSNFTISCLELKVSILMSCI